LTPHAIELAVERYWEHERLAPEVSGVLRVALLEDVRHLDSRSDKDRGQLTTRPRNLRQERYRWAEKAMAGAVPDDIAQEKQVALAQQISHTQARLAALQVAAVDIQATIESCLELEHCAVAYRLAPPNLRREWNQAWWQWLEVDLQDDSAQGPVVRRSERTPIVEAVMTAEAEKPQVTTATWRRLHQGLKVFSLCDGSRVQTLVRARGLEPPPLSGPGPKPGASAGFATPACARDVPYPKRRRLQGGVGGLFGPFGGQSVVGRGPTEPGTCRQPKRGL
jgi:hypothetical protein